MKIPAPTPSPGPTFLCIGAAKAGTTWLWENLERHPQIWMPPLKELHWFDVLHPPRGLGGTSGFVHRRGIGRYTLLYRRPSLRNALWLHKFYSSLERGGNYCDLFDRRGAPHMGDVTPAYAILDADVIAQLHATLPADCRIIFIMREPADRLWSGLRMYCRHNALRMSALSEERIDALSRLPEHDLRTNYLPSLQNWSIFSDRFGVFFYEDMQADPAAFLRGILEFIGADATWQSPLLHHISNAGESSSGPPPRLLQEWRRRYSGVVSGVRSWAGRVPDAWQY